MKEAKQQVLHSELTTRRVSAGPKLEVHSHNQVADFGNSVVFHFDHADHTYNVQLILTH